MAYRKKSARKSYGRKPARKSYGRKPAKRRTAKRRTTKRKSSPRTQKIVLVVQQAPATPTLATPAAKAKPVRARFGG